MNSKRRTLEDMANIWTKRSPTSVCQDCQNASPKWQLKQGSMRFKEKTEMCRHRFKPNHNRENCSYAHSVEELRMTVVPESYKTVLCTNFWGPNGERIGKCRFGDKCSFAHDSTYCAGRSLKQKAGKKYKTVLCKFKTTSKCPFGTTCAFKHKDEVEKQTRDDVPLLLLPSDLME